MESRKETYFRLSTRLALQEDRALQSLLSKTKAGGGWGKNRVISVDETKVFTKSIPITDREYARPYSTRNLFRMPSYYNYGVGSAGFGAFREVATHVKTTNWVLGGAIANFPLMYHCRILPVANALTEMKPKQLDGYIRYWNGSKSIRQYIEARQAAKYEAVLFLEYIPYVLDPWMTENLGAIDAFLTDLRKTVDFLQQHGIVHFDAHRANILTDGQTFYLTDFGLVLDREFDLTPREQDFLARHAHYDYGEFSTCLLGPLFGAVRKLGTDTLGDLAERYDPGDPLWAMRNVEELCSSGTIQLDEGYLNKLLQYRELITAMNEFFVALQQSPKKNAVYDDDKIAKLLSTTASF